MASMRDGGCIGLGKTILIDADRIVKPREICVIGNSGFQQGVKLVLRREKVSAELKTRAFFKTRVEGFGKKQGPVEIRNRGLQLPFGLCFQTALMKKRSYCVTRQPKRRQRKKTGDQNKTPKGKPKTHELILFHKKKFRGIGIYRRSVGELSREGRRSTISN